MKPILATVSLLMLLASRLPAGEKTEKPILVLDAGGHSATASNLAFTPDGKELISASFDHTIRFWNVKTGELARVLRLPVYAGSGAGKLALAPDGQLLAVSLVNSRKEFCLALMALPEDGALRLLTGHTDGIWCLAFSSDGKKIASGSRDKTARIWDVQSGRCLHTLSGHAAPVSAVAFSPDGKRLASCSFDSTGRIWEVETGREEAVLKDSENSTSMCSIAWSPDGKTIATGSLGTALRLWAPDGTLLKRHADLPTARSIHFSKDSKSVLFAGDLRVRGGHLFDLEKEQIRASRPLQGGFSWAAVLSPDERLAAAAGGLGEDLYLWSTADGTVLHRLSGRGRTVIGAAWGSDGKTIAWGTSFSEEPDMFKPGYLHLSHPLERSFDLEALDFGPQPAGNDWRRCQPTSGNLSAEVAIEDNRSRGWVNVKDDGEVIRTLEHYWSSVCTFLPGERVVVGGSGLKMYQARTGEVLRTFTGTATHSLALAPDNRYLLAPGADQTLRIWKLDRDDPLLSLFFAGNDWIAWTPEGYYAASGGGEKLMGWQVNNGADRLATFHPAAQFRKSLYRPDVIKLLLKTGSVEKALEAADQARGARTEATEVGNVLPPSVRLLAPAKNQKVSDAAVEVRARASSTGSHPVTALQLLLDGRPLMGQGGLVRVESPRLGDVDASWNITFTPGKHRLTVRAESAVSSGLSEEVEVAYTAPDLAELPSLYVLAVGISDYPGPLKLNYASKDAQTLANAFQARSKTLFAKVEVKEITDKKATQREILKGITWLSKKMTQRDVGVVFLAGHGEIANNGSFYFLPADVDPDEIAATGVHAEQIKTMLAAMPGKIVLLLDACHAGAASKQKRRTAGALTDDLIRDLAADERGIIVMGASTGRQFSLESDEHKQGLFTLALVEGLQGKAKQVDGQVYLHHLDAYVTDRVRELSRGEQSPTTARPASIRSFALSRP
jgi:WD40 repeat protein